VKKSIKYLLISAIIAFAASCSSGDDGDDGGGNGGNPNPPDPAPGTITLQKKEMRGVWIATVWSLDWPQSDYTVAGQKKKFTDLLDKLVATNVNAVFVQIRPNADAFYNSQYEPWSKWITGVPGKDPGYDVLAFMLEEAHKRDLEFHAWLNPYRIETRSSTGTPYSQLDAKIDPDLVKSYDKIRIYNPARPEVQDKIANIVKDIITKYDVDGIHMDDYFYPDPNDYSSLDDAQDYATYGAGYANVSDFRFGNVNKVVKKIYDVIAATKPEVVFSISPAGDNGFNRTLYADVQKWCQEGWVDIIIPQLYSSTGSETTNFNYRVGWWPQYSYKAVTMIGYGLYRFGDGTSGAKFQTTSELMEQFRLANAQPKVLGSVMYSAKYFNENKIGIIDALKNNIYNKPAVIPFAGRKVAADPRGATNLSVTGGKLKWTVVGTLRSVVYRVADNKGTVVAITNDSEFTLPDKGDYAVTTLNADNVESALSDVVTYK